MSRFRLIRVLVAARFAVTIPSTALAQGEPVDPEGSRWDLTAYASDGELVPVPWTVDAMLALETGVASGNDGRSPYSGLSRGLLVGLRGGRAHRRSPP